MNELYPHQPNVQSKEREAAILVEITGELLDMINGKESGPDGADGLLDKLSVYCRAVAQRDPEMGRLLVQALESAPTGGGESATYRSAVAGQDISPFIRQDLGMWPSDEIAGLPPSTR